MDDFRAAFGHRVRELRERSGLSQEDVAEYADLHVTYVSGIERGRRNPGLNTLFRLARAFRVSPQELLADLRQVPRAKPHRGRPSKKRRA